jgi:hypothetical protein
VLNDLNRYLLYFPEENPRKLDHDEIIVVSYFKHLKNLEKTRRTNGSSPASLPLENKKSASVTSSIVTKSFKNRKASKMWCQYCEKTTTTQLIAEKSPNLSNRKRLIFGSQIWTRKEIFGLPF